MYMWQSRIEIEGYPIVYFDRTATFEALYCWTSVNGGAYMCYVNLLDIHTSMKHVWAPPLMEVQWYGTSNAEMQLKYVME